MDYHDLANCNDGSSYDARFICGVFFKIIVIFGRYVMLRKTDRNETNNAKQERKNGVAHGG